MRMTFVGRIQNEDVSGSENSEHFPPRHLTQEACMTLMGTGQGLQTRPIWPVAHDEQLDTVHGRQPTDHLLDPLPRDKAGHRDDFESL